MPYGLSKQSGGDSAANDAKMERCIARLTAQGKPKLTSILICKASIQGTTKHKKKK